MSPPSRLLPYTVGASSGAICSSCAPEASCAGPATGSFRTTLNSPGSSRFGQKREDDGKSRQLPTFSKLGRKCDCSRLYQAPSRPDHGRVPSRGRARGGGGGACWSARAVAVELDGDGGPRSPIRDLNRETDFAGKYLILLALSGTFCKI
jgi:hypothetical protein